MLIDGSQDCVVPILFTDPSTGASASPDALPIFRVFSDLGPIVGGNGTADYLESKTISAIAVGATTIITSAGHGLVTGAVVTIAGAAGTTNVNGTHQVTVIDANNFSFTGSVSSGVYTSGATWKTPGLFGCTLDSSIRSSLEAGKNYLLIAYGVFSSVVRAVKERFTVVS
jgi:hypothetical protein